MPEAAGGGVRNVVVPGARALSASTRNTAFNSQSFFVFNLQASTGDNVLTSLPLGGGAPSWSEGAYGSGENPLALSAVADDSTVYVQGESSLTPHDASTGMAGTPLTSGYLYGHVSQNSTTLFVATKTAIEAIPKSGGSATQLVPETMGGLFAADETNVYWVSGGQSILRVSVQGGTPETLATGITFPNAGAYPGPIADDTRIYWFSGSGNTYAVMALAK
jgi:hypothetical protein